MTTLAMAPAPAATKVKARAYVSLAAKVDAPDTAMATNPVSLGTEPEIVAVSTTSAFVPVVIDTAAEVVPRFA